jgi:lysophospholipid acyltransferase (LPLAT)-like uncharacterized protein
LINASVSNRALAAIIFIHGRLTFLLVERQADGGVIAGLVKVLGYNLV